MTTSLDHRDGIEGRLRTALLILLLLAPLPFGCVEDWSRWILVTLLGLTFCGFLRARVPWRLTLRDWLALGAGVGLLIWMALQILPLPPRVLANGSASAHGLYRIAVPGYGEIDPRGYGYPEIQSAGPGARPSASWITPHFGTWRSLSLSPYVTYRVLCQTAALLLFVVMCLSLFHQPRHRRGLAIALVGAGAFEAIYGILEAATGHQHIFGYEKRYYTDVATGTLVNRNHFAAMLNLALPLAVALVLGRTRTPASPQSPGAVRMRLLRLLGAGGEPLFLCASVVMGMGIMMSRSRMGIISMLVGLLSLSLMAAWFSARDAHHRSEDRSRLSLRWALALPLLLLVLIGTYSLGVDSGGSLDRFFQISSDLKAGATRPALWKEALPVVRDFFWTGAGAGAYVNALNPHVKDLPVLDFWIYNHAHSDYLETVATLGIIGLLLLLTALAALVVRRPPSLLSAGAMAGLITILLHSATDFPLSIPSNALMVCALLCLAAPTDAPASRTARWAASRPSRRRFATSTVILFVLVAAWPARAALAALVYRSQWNSSLDRPEAIRALRISSFLDPGNDYYLRLLGQGERATALKTKLGQVNVGEDLQRQVVSWQTTRLEGLASSQRHLIASLDRSPVDYGVHADIALVGAALRGLTQQMGLAPPMADTDPRAALAPYLASVALAPNAYGNRVVLGSLLWSQREEVGEFAAITALDILRPAVGRPGAEGPWVEGVLRTAGDTPSLALADRGLEPGAASYDAILGPLSQDAPTDLIACVRVFRALAELRDIGREVRNMNRDLPGGADLDRLRGFRARLETLRQTAPSLTVTPGGAPARCGDERADPGAIARDIDHLLSVMAPPPC